MNPQQAINVLDQATEPNVQLKKADYVLVHKALECLKDFVNKHFVVTPEVVNNPDQP